MPEPDIPESIRTVVIHYQFGRYWILVIKGFIKVAKIHSIIYQTTCGRAYQRYNYYLTSVGEDIFHRLLGLDSDNERLDEIDGEGAQPITTEQASTNTPIVTPMRLLQKIASSLLFLWYVMGSSKT